MSVKRKEEKGKRKKRKKLPSCVLVSGWCDRKMTVKMVVAGDSAGGQ